MWLLVAGDATRRKPVPRKDSFLTGMNLGSGTPKTKDLNYGIFSMGIKTSESISGFFRSATGLNLTYGSIL